MLCEKCNTREATVLIREIINGNATERHLCGQCAQENGIGALFDADSAFGRLLSGILGKSLTGTARQEDEADDITCPCCGMTYGEFVKESRFGCSECYDTFGLLIQDNIKKLQGSDRHVGKHPKNFTPIRAAVPHEAERQMSAREELEILSERQREAILEEDYEEAAALRDRIRAIREKLEGGL